MLIRYLFTMTRATEDTTDRDKAATVLRAEHLSGAEDREGAH